jgi:hypothetical protein
MSLYQNLRALHLSTALFSAVFLLAYAIGAVEFAHRKWFDHPEQSTEETRRLAPGITDARILAREWRGELESIEKSPGVLKFRVVASLGTTHAVTYSIATGDTTIKTTTISFLTTLAWIHRSHGIWAFVAAFVSLGLLTLGATGIYLWFRNRSERWIGAILMVFGAGITLGLIISMRGG